MERTIQMAQILINGNLIILEFGYLNFQKKNVLLITN